MTCRLIIWCGHVDRANRLDAPTSRNDIEHAVQAARALGIGDREMWSLVCDHELLPLGFRGQKGQATVDGLHRAAACIAGQAGPDDGLLFVATNHGDFEGLLTAGESDRWFDAYANEATDAILSPSILAASLDAIAGQQVVLIGACHAGLFSPIAGDRRLVMCSVPADSPDYIHVATHPPRNLFLYEVLSHGSGTSLANIQPPARCSLDAAYGKAHEQCPDSSVSGKVVWPE